MPLDVHCWYHNRTAGYNVLDCFFLLLERSAGIIFYPFVNVLFYILYMNVVRLYCVYGTLS